MKIMTVPAFLAVSLLLPSVSQAVTPMTTFTSGTSISSTSVNNNFTNLYGPLNALEARVLGTYTFPAANGASGQYLMTDGAGTLSWGNPGGGSGLTQLNGLTNSTQSFSFGSAGSTPTWSSAGSLHTLNIPLASSPGTVSGLLSFSDWTNFNNKISSGGNSLGSTMTIGTTDYQHVVFKSDNLERMRLDKSGYVGIGTIVPTATLHVKDANNATSNPGMMVETTLTGSVDQAGLLVRPIVTQSSSASYTAIKVNVDDTGTIATGARKLLDLQTSSSSKFVVDSEGYFNNNGFMGQINSSVGATCIMGGLTMPAHYAVVDSMTNMDFGTFTAGYNISTGGVYEVLLDAPFTGSGFGQVYFILWNGSVEIPLVQGRNVKRLPSGIWKLAIGCSTATSGNINIVSASTVFGMRKLH